jgi:hypothetical protein
MANKAHVSWQEGSAQMEQHQLPHNMQLLHRATSSRTRVGAR